MKTLTPSQALQILWDRWNAEEEDNKEEENE